MGGRKINWDGAQRRNRAFRSGHEFGGSIVEEFRFASRYGIFPGDLKDKDKLKRLRNKKACPVCGKWVRKEKFRDHVKGAHPSEKIVKRAPKRAKARAIAAPRISKVYKKRQDGQISELYQVEERKTPDGSTILLAICQFCEERIAVKSFESHLFNVHGITP